MGVRSHKSFSHLIALILQIICLSAFAGDKLSKPHVSVGPLAQVETCVTQTLVGLPSAALHEFRAADPASFRNALISTRHPEHPDRVWVRTEEQYREFVATGGHLFLSAEGSTGFGVSHDGELVSLFNNSMTKGLGAQAVIESIKLGVTHLHCWGIDLTKYYARFGFKIVQEHPWNEDYWVNDDPPPGPKPSLYHMHLGDEPHAP